MPFLPLLASCLLLCICSLPAHAVDITPFYTVNQNPLVQVYGLPAPDHAVLQPHGKIGSLLVVDIASNFGIHENAREKIVLDGESYRATLGFRYGVARGIEAGIDIPYVFYSTGFLDGFIRDFHEAFGFAQGGRDDVPKNRLLLEYSRNGVQQFRISRPNSGIGDIRLLGGVQLYHDRSDYPGALALRMSLKLPTGDSSQLQGSGGTDFALWLTGSDHYRLGSGRIGLFGAAGGLAMSRGDVLPQQHRDLVGFGSAGVGWSPVAAFSVTAQANVHTSFYKNSDLVELDADTVQLSFGFTFLLPADVLLDVAVTEDVIYTSSSPDMTCTFALRKKF